MTIRYCDLLNGNDSNDGSSFLLRKKTLSSASSGLVPGDTVRVMGTPRNYKADGTWSSSNITISAPISAHINTGTSAWTPGGLGGSTSTTSATIVKYGGAITNCAWTSSFTGKLGYAPCSTVDLSAFSSVSFFFTSSVALTNGQLVLDLCSDSLGNTPVQSLSLNAVGANSATLLFPITKVTGALPSNVNSVAFRFASASPTSGTIKFNHIIACSDITGTNGINLNTIVSADDELGYYPIKSIDGTTITLDLYNGYPGSTSFTGIYFINPILKDITNPTEQIISTSASPLSTWLVTGGSTEGLVNFEFGWNSDMTLQNTVTAFDVQYYTGSMVPNADYLYVNKLFGIRTSTIASASYQINRLEFGELASISNYTAQSSTSQSCEFKGDTLHITGTAFLTNPTLSKNTVINNLYVVGTQTVTGINTGNFNFNLINNFKIYSSLLTIGSSTYDGVINNLYVNHGTLTTLNYAVSFVNNNVNCYIKNLTFANVNYIFNLANPGKITVDTTTGTPLIGFVTLQTTVNNANADVFVKNYNGTGLAKGFRNAISINSVSTPVTGSSTKSWELKNNCNFFYYPVTSGNANPDYYRIINKKLAEIPVKAGTNTISMQAYRLYTTSTACIFFNNNFVKAEMSAGANTWETLTLTYVASADEVLNLYVSCQYDTVNAGQLFYISNLSVS